MLSATRVAGAVRPVVRSTRTFGFRAAQQRAAAFRQVRRASDHAVGPQVEGGLRGVVGTLSLVEGDASYVEAWVPDSKTSLRCGDAWAAGNAEAFAGVRKAHEALDISTGVMARAMKSHEAEFVDKATEEDVPGIETRGGEYSCVALPVMHNDVLVCVFMLLYQPAKLPPLSQLKRLRGDLTVAVSHIMEGATTSADSLHQTSEEIFDTQLQKVTEILKAEGVFSAETIDHEVREFYHLGISPLYFAQNNPIQIAKHLNSFIGAKTAARSTTVDNELHGEADHGIMSFQFIGQKDATFFCLDEVAEREQMIHKLNQYVDATPEGLTASVTMFRSKEPIMHGKSLIMTTATRSRFLNPSFGKTQKPDIWQVSSASFLRTKSKRTRSRYEKMLTRAHGQLFPISEVRSRDPGHVVMFVFPDQAPENGLIQLFNVLDVLKLRCTQLFAETFANGAVTYNIYLENLVTQRTDKELQRNLVSLTRRMTTLAVLPRSARMNTSAVMGPRAKLYLGCAQVFTYHFMPHRSEDFHALREYLKSINSDVSVDRLDRMGRTQQKDAVNIQRFNWTIQNYPDLAWAVYDDFMTPRKPGAEPGDRLRRNLELEKQIKTTVTDPLDQEILLSCLLFNRTILKTNFFSREKAATSFRLDPSMFISEDYPEVPHAVFMVVGSSFEGFHIRFRDISRGGIRMIRSPNQAYFKNQQSLFEENYNLAYTQQLKNKDIPEGGSKGTILLNPDKKAQSSPDEAFHQYIDSLLDLILPNDQVVDLLGDKEILFFGPDEGTAGKVVVWAAEHARRREYPYWKSITTGKPATMGGIPHDTYGMTTRSVHQNVLGVLRAQGLKEEEVTKFQTGGPDGDLGSNEILISKDKTVAIVDGSGVLCDPEGLDRAEITRLAKLRSMIVNFDVSKLSPKGYRVLIDERDVKLPSGEVIESGLLFRNEFHLRTDLEADLFVPCGGRPNAVNINNVDRMFKKDGVTPRFKYVCEGANLFFTRDARRRMEDAGVVLIKDATCNKGGVTSSSLEVLAALAMTEEQHNSLMCVHPDGLVPEFYDSYVQEVQAKIEENARLEFEALWRERESGNQKYMVTTTDLLSKKINSFNDMMQSSPTLKNNKQLQRLILSKALPKLLIEKLTLETILARVPENYLMAICGAYFAAQYVYKYGLMGSEVHVLDFIQEFVHFSQE